MNWQETCLGNHTDLISGATFKSAVFTDDENDIPLIKGENIGQGKILWDKSRYWPADDIDQYEKCWLKPGDVILAMDRPWVTAGLKFAQIKDSDPPSLLVQRVARMRGTKGLETNYLRYIVGSKPFSDYVKNIMGGTNVPHISGGQIRSYKFLLPPNGQQINIIHHLKPYDDLIENNRRRIALLEEAARQLYKEWFIRFRFPGHEHVNIVDGIPEGWVNQPLSQYIHIKHGYAFKGEYFSEDQTKRILLTPGNFKVGGGIKTEKLKYYSEDGPLNEEYLLSKGDLILTMTDLSKTSDTLGYPLLVPSLRKISFLHNQRIGKVDLKGKGYFPKFLFYHLFQDFRYRGHVVGSATGTSVKHTSPAKICNYCPIIPWSLDDGLVRGFDEFAENNHQQILCLIEQNDLLAQARDILLPKLMNGEIAV